MECLKENIYDFQVGDEVYILINAQMLLSKITLIDTSKVYSVNVDGYGGFTLDGKLASNDDYISLFHKEAITLDEKGRFTAIDYNFRPDRDLKVKATKLPHEFVEGEKVLVRDYVNSLWKLCTFESFSNNAFCPFNAKELRICWKYCIPYEGNEHLKDKITPYMSGDVPEDYNYTEHVAYIANSILKPFDKVLVRDRKENKWQTSFFSYMTNLETYKYQCSGLSWKYCIPYNEETEHLIGTSEDWGY